MGSPEGGDGGGVEMDCSVGTIVWVRRRNGSWWPGRILGLHELSASHLMSPRSGTPVKLLGREDASVDWYNLEKSKRVKAFRCGEFDACIERAEASQGVPIKKREKYARREDAILHALELEKGQLEKKRQKLGTNCNSLDYKHSGALKKELNRHSASELHLMSDECMDHGKASNLKPQSDLLMSSDEVNGSSPINAQKNRSGTNWDDDNSEAMPRMRGLQDFGLRIAPSKRKASSTLVFERAKHSLINNHAVIFPDSRHSMRSGNIDGPGKISSSIKRKRSHSGLVEESLVKRRDRRRPLVQVLKSSAQLPALQSLQTNCESGSILAQEEKEKVGAVCHAKRSSCIYLPADSSNCSDHTGYSSDQMQILPTQFVYTNGLHQLGSLPGEDTSSGLIIGDVTCLSEGDCMGTDVEEETTVLQDDKWLESKNSERCIKDDVSALEDQEMLGNTSNAFEASLSNCNPHIHSNDEAAGAADMGVSKWHMKGKRNSRNLSKRTAEFLDGKGSVMPSDYCSGSLNAVYEKKQSIFKTDRERMFRRGFYHKDGELNYAYEDDIFEKDLNKKLVGIEKQQHPLMLKPSSRDHAVGGISHSDEDSHEMFPSCWEADEPLYLDRKAYWEESDDWLGHLFVHPLKSEVNPPLIDVDLKVQASYHGERVPLVSLMSRLNGKAIIGHPVHVEILRDHYTDLLFPRNGFGVETIGSDEHSGPPPVWRTGRRTAMQRVPRADLAPSAFEGDGGELDLCSEIRPLFKEPHTAPTLQTSSMKNSSHQHHLMTGKSHKKLPKRGSLTTQKTRTLSSLVTVHKRTVTNASAKHRRKDNTIFGGLTKPGSTMPLVACVPVKVVFSRILEAVGRPPSTGTAQRGLLTGFAERNPL